MVKYVVDGELAWYDFRDRSDHLLIYRTVPNEHDEQHGEQAVAGKGTAAELEQARMMQAARKREEEKEREQLTDMMQWSSMRGKAFNWVEQQYVTTHRSVDRYGAMVIHARQSL